MNRKGETRFVKLVLGLSAQELRNFRTYAKSHHEEDSMMHKVIDHILLCKKKHIESQFDATEFPNVSDIFRYGYKAVVKSIVSSRIHNDSESSFFYFLGKVETLKEKELIQFFEIYSDYHLPDLNKNVKKISFNCY